MGLTQANGTVNAYDYDYRTRRVRRQEGSSAARVAFSGGVSVLERPGSGGGAPSARFVRGGPELGGGVGGLLYSLRAGSGPSFAHYDSRGDVVMRTDGAGAVTSLSAYDAFGSRSQTWGASEERQQANTKEEDPTGLLNEGMRYRDLEAGVFITRDPAGFVDGPNLYTYVRQNPWSKFDPEGLSALDFIAGVIQGGGEALLPWTPSRPAHPNADYQSGLHTGHIAGAAISIGEMDGGAGMAGTGAAGLTFGTTVMVGGVATGPGELVAGPTGAAIDIGSAGLVLGGGALTIHGAWAANNSARLLADDMRDGGGSAAGGSPEGSAKTTKDASGKEVSKVDHAENFDKARERAFERAGMTDPDNVEFSKVDPKTGTVVEFKGKGNAKGAKVSYDSAHADMDASKGHDQPHVGWQTAGKRSQGGAGRGNITYKGEQHPSRSDIKE